MSEQDWKKKVVDMKHSKIQISDAAAELAKLLDRYDWFYDIIIEDSRAITVYVEHMGKEVCDLIPDFVYGYQVKIAFSSYLTCAEKYGAKPMALGSVDEYYE